MNSRASDGDGADSATSSSSISVTVVPFGGRGAHRPLVRRAADQLDIGGPAKVVPAGSEILLLEVVGEGIALTLPPETTGGDEAGKDDHQTDHETEVHKDRYYRPGSC